MAPLLHFNVVAWLSDGSRRSSTDRRAESVAATSPESAARMWFWRLTEAERQTVDRVIVWPPKPHRIYAVYDGPVVVYRRQDGRLVEVERRG